MKRLVCILLFSTLLMCSCQKQGESLPTAQTDTEEKGHEEQRNEQMNKDSAAFLLDDKVIYDCACSEDGTVSVSLNDPNDRRVIAQPGGLVALCGKYLLKRDGQRLLALPVSDLSAQWIAIATFSENRGIVDRFPIQRGTEWIFWNPSVDGEALVFDEETCSAKFVETPQGVCDWERQGETLYYTVAEEKGGYLLYSCDLNFESRKELARVDQPLLEAVGERIACYSTSGFPGIYDCKAQRYERMELGHQVDRVQVGGGILVAQYWVDSEIYTEKWAPAELAIEIATGTELDASEYAEIRISEWGKYTAYRNEEGAWRFVGDGKEQTISNLPAFSFFTADKERIVLNGFGRTTLIRWKNGTVQTIYHE